MKRRTSLNAVSTSECSMEIGGHALRGNPAGSGDAGKGGGDGGPKISIVRRTHTSLAAVRLRARRLCCTHTHTVTRNNAHFHTLFTHLPVCGRATDTARMQKRISCASFLPADTVLLL